jgi:hypothetical protein
MISKLTMALVIMIALSLSVSASADTIYLNNGGKISGKVVKENDTTVTIDIGGGTVVQNKSDIVRIKTEDQNLTPKESDAFKAAEEESATPMLDTKKGKKGVFGMIEGMVDTAFSILKFDFLKKEK